MALWLGFQNQYFYPRPPRGGRPMMNGCCLSRLLFLSTPSARRATENNNPIIGFIKISIHALREEGDLFAPDKEFAPTKISIHALREEGDRPNINPIARPINFYPRPPRGGRRICQSPIGRGDPISIHALREEGDDPGYQLPLRPSYFYPRPPRGGRQQKQRKNTLLLS